MKMNDTVGRSCDMCTNCKVVTLTRLTSAYFRNGGVCPPQERKVINVRCTKESDTAVTFPVNYKSIEEFMAGEDNFTYAQDCAEFEYND